MHSLVILTYMKDVIDGKRFGHIDRGTYYGIVAARVSITLEYSPQYHDCVGAHSELWAVGPASYN